MGLEAAIRVDDPGPCPVASASEQTGTRIDSVSRSSTADRVFEEFEIDADDKSLDTAEEVFTDDRYGVYRFERDRKRACFCERVEAFGCPVVDIRSTDGGLRVLFRPDDVEALKRIVETLREEFDGIHLEHLVQSGDPAEKDSVVVDRNRLTDRQREVLETAYEMGYFEHPKGANAQEVAAELGINSATLRGHLSAAQSKLLESILEH